MHRQGVLAAVAQPTGAVRRLPITGFRHPVGAEAGLTHQTRREAEDPAAMLDQQGRIEYWEAQQAQVQEETVVLGRNTRFTGLVGVAEGVAQRLRLETAVQAENTEEEEEGAVEAPRRAARVAQEETATRSSSHIFDAQLRYHHRGLHHQRNAVGWRKPVHPARRRNRHAAGNRAGRRLRVRTCRSACQESLGVGGRFLG